MASAPGGLGDLLITMRADIATLQSDLGKAQRVIETSSRRMSSVFNGLASGLKSLVPALGAVQIGRFFVGTITKAIDLGDELGRLSEKTGVAGSALSQLRFASEQADVPFESLADSLTKLQRNLAEATTGNKQAASTFRALGLSAKELQGLSADRALELVADRIAGITNESSRAQAAVDVFGKSGADLLPLMTRGSSGIRALREEAVRLGAALTDDQIASLGKADEAVKRLSFAWSGFATTLTAKVEPALSGVLGYLQRTINPDTETRLKRINTELQNMATAADRGGIKALEAEKAAILAEISRQRIIAAGGGFRGRGVTKEKASNGPTEYDPGAADRAAKALDEARKKAERFRDALAEIRQDLYTGIPESVQRTADSIDQTFGTDPFDVKQIAVDVGALNPEFEKMGAAFKERTDDMSVYADQAARNMQDAFADFLFDPFKGGLKGMLTGFVNILRRMVAEAAAAQIFKSLFGDKGGGSTLGTIFGSLFGGGKAVGGTVSGGMSYLVGERGPDLLTMGRGQSGVITPNNKLGGGGAITIAPNYTFNGTGLSQEQIFALMARNNRDMARATTEAMKRARLPAPRY